MEKGPQRWQVPTDDCVFLPVSNTTAELIAKWVAVRVREGLVGEKVVMPSVIRVEIEESPGQSAFYELAG